MPTRPFSSFRYYAFMSYAHYDDKAWNSWVSCFTVELDRALVSRLRGIKVPRAHLSSKDGPIHGPLNEGLRSNVQDSFAMLVFVHDNYLDSDWCLQEMKYFRDLFGEQGFRERLYIIAMSEDAIHRLTARKAWQELFPLPHQVWMPFFQEDKSDRPIPIYATNMRGRDVVVANEFWDKFVELRERLATHIKENVETERHVPGYPKTVASSEPVGVPPADQSLVRVYIEASVEQQKYWEPLGRQVANSWERIVADERMEPPLYLRPTGLPMGEIDERPFLDDANGVVLLWGKKTPDSLAAQISQVEPKLSGPQFAPGLIAYIMENSADRPSSTTINNWPVVRFAAAPDSSAVVDPDDALLLTRFLREVLAHKRRADLVPRTHATPTP